jgi:hypothetical protein
VLLTYLDESYTKKRYLIAALMVPDAQARSLTAALDKVVEDAAWDYSVSTEAELHAHDMECPAGLIADAGGLRGEAYRDRAVGSRRRRARLCACSGGSPVSDPTWEAGR